MNHTLPALLLDGSPVVLLASCLGEKTGGGLFAYDGSTTERIDTLSTTGIAFTGEKLLRLLYVGGRSPGGELLVCDRLGVERYQRLDFIRQAHDVAWDGECYIVVSTGSNTIFKISAGGKIVSQWKMDGEGDCWHLNCLLQHGPALLVSAFGVFSGNREWSGHQRDGSGIVIDVETKKTLVGGLDCPHHPRLIDGALAVCNSARNELLQIDPASGEILRRVQLACWTRGLAASDDYIFVGESNRALEAPEKTSIAVLCRKTWEVLGRVVLKCDEIYDLLLVPPEIAEGARRGFRNNPKREDEQNQRNLFQQAGVEPATLWALGDPLPLAACKAEIKSAVPPLLKAGSTLQLKCSIKNTGTDIFVSAPPNPVLISYKWNGAEESNKEVFVQGDRTLLPRSLPPGRSAVCDVEIHVPPDAGRFMLTVTLVQEHHVWFDQVDGANAFYTEVLVGANAQT